MRTTVRLEDGLLEQAKREARRRWQTLTSLIDQGLRLARAQPVRRPHQKKFVLPVSKQTGGVMPGVDLNNGAALLDIMEADGWKG